MNKTIITLGCLCGFFACIKPPSYPIEPVIEFTSLSKVTIQQSTLNEDSITINFTFTDGDGDLGDSDSINIFVTDTRQNFIANKFRIPFIPPEGAANGISGEVSIVTYSTCCIFPDGQVPCTPSVNYPVDTLTYKVQIKDRAGNLSNIIETPPIFVLCNQ